MDKKRELLAKTLLDASKIMFVSIFAAYMLNNNQFDWYIFNYSILVIIIIGYMGWIIHPKDTKKEGHI